MYIVCIVCIVCILCIVMSLVYTLLLYSQENSGWTVKTYLNCFDHTKNDQKRPTQFVSSECLQGLLQAPAFRSVSAEDEPFRKCGGTFGQGLV